MLGGKKRYLLQSPLDLSDSWPAILRGLRHEAPDEWGVYLSANSPPTLLTRYRREYCVTSNGAVRATLDYELRSYDQRYSLRPNLGQWLPLTEQVIIELKAGPEEARQLELLVSHFPIPRTKKSKYVSGVLTSF